MSAAKKQTKQDLENKIAELEAKLNKLATQLEAKPTAPKPAETKPAEVKPTAPKPAEVKQTGMTKKQKFLDTHNHQISTLQQEQDSHIIQQTKCLAVLVVHL